MKIKIIHWKPVEIKDHITRLSVNGSVIDSDLFKGPEDFKRIRENPPDAIIIDLNRLPFQGRDIAITFRKYKDTRYVPLIFIEGDKIKTKKVKSLLPDAFYAKWLNIEEVLKHALDNPVKDPVVYKSSMEAYSGSSLNKKLGIKENMVIALINAPDKFSDKFSMIEKLKFVKKTINGRDLTIWFTLSKTELDSRIKDVVKTVGKGGIWIAWKKKNKSADSDLSQVIVRKAGLSYGLVDYKICSIDEIWSALKFGLRNKL